jgi:hypothetical protein
MLSNSTQIAPYSRNALDLKKKKEATHIQVAS